MVRGIGVDGLERTSAQCRVILFSTGDCTEETLTFTFISSRATYCILLLLQSLPTHSTNPLFQTTYFLPFFTSMLLQHVFFDDALIVYTMYSKKNVGGEEKTSEWW
jgi:hypothetical protein